jgi:hypothetical protein
MPKSRKNLINQMQIKCKSSHEVKFWGKTKEGEASIEVANVRVPRYLIYYKVKKQEES